MNLNPKTKLIIESLTLKLNSLANELSAKGKNIINLTAGELDFPKPLYIQKEVKNKVNLNKYTPTVGISTLKHMIAGQIYKDYKWKVTAENVAVTAGGKQALFESMFAILQEGDEVIIPTPGWVTYKYHIILNSPNNPSGSFYSAASLIALKKIIKNKAIYLIVDDIYSKIIYDKTYRTPALFAPQKKYLILINSFSKSQALAGWRVGYVIANKEIIQAVTSYQSHTTGNVSLLSQIAAQEIIKKGDKTIY